MAYKALERLDKAAGYPSPANLPSLKIENLGNNPTVYLVPTGSPRWGKKEKETPKSEEQV